MATRNRFAHHLCIATFAAAVGCFGSAALAQTVVNPSFEDLTGWTLDNDATLAHPGGMAPWSWNTPLVASVVVNATETVLPVDGLGMGITYAGGDEFLQSVVFPADGNYTLSVLANSISGTSTAGGGVPLVNGRFELFVDGDVSPANVPITTDGWALFEWTTFVTAGAHDIGLRNTLGAAYSIAYDNFSIIPEPGVAALLGLGLLGLARRRRRI